MYEDKKDTSILLVLFTSFIYVFIAIFVIFFIGLSKVEATSFNENLYWDTPTWIQYYSSEPFATNGSTSPGQSILQACNKTPYCLAPDGFPKYALIGYNITDNSTDSTISAFENGDKFKFQVKLDYMLQSTSINHYVDFDFKITSGNSVYNAYCDSGEKLDINYVEQDERYEINYTCDVFNVDRSIRYFMFQLYSSNDLFYSVGVLENFSVIVTPLDAGDIIANQNQNTQDIINNANQNTQEIIDSVTSPDISGSNDTIGGFFGSFSDTDHGGLSGIITAPLIAFNQMLTGTCTDLSVEYEGSTTTLPCGTSFWNQISPIRDFLNITLGGLICYQIVRKLFLLIQKIKNPDDDRVEVMSL